MRRPRFGRTGQERPELIVAKVALEPVPLRGDLLLPARLPAAAPLLDRTSALISSESVSGMRSRLRRVNRSFGFVPRGASYQIT